MKTKFDTILSSYWQILIFHFSNFCLLPNRDVYLPAFGVSAAVRLLTSLKLRTHLGDLASELYVETYNVAYPNY